MRGKLDKTLADYSVIAISPALIMAMVGSFVFLLLEMGYSGDYANRLRWTLFWFVLASVLVSRISIQHGSTSAMVYGLGLALATGLMLAQFVDAVFLVWALLALIWWCTSKLTWDCTLIDEEEDASGQGLLQAGGLEENCDEKRTELAAPAAQQPTRERPLDHRSKTPAPPKTPHAPGLWIIYFSLAALPLFGIGQLLLPESEPDARRFAFMLLLIYVASALGLLLSTSFLGLRRYLRQRHLQMPRPMAASWMAWGAALALIVLIGSILLPRPQAQYSLSALAGKIGSPDQESSRFSWLRKNAVQEDGEQEHSDAGWKRDPKNPGGQPDRISGGNQGPGQENRRGSTSPSSSPSFLSFDSSVPWPWLAWLLRGLVYAGLLLLFLYFLKRNWERIKSALREIWNQLQRFIRSLFGAREPEGMRGSADGAPPDLPARFKAFSAFRNPFASGLARRMSLSDLLTYSFEALEAWARENGTARRPDQTPLEFGQHLGQVHLMESGHAEQIAHLYSGLAYANRVPSSECLESLERLWRHMELRKAGI